MPPCRLHGWIRTEAPGLVTRRFGRLLGSSAGLPRQLVFEVTKLLFGVSDGLLARALDFLGLALGLVLLVADRSP